MVLCESMWSEHTELLLHTEVRWLSRGRIFELRDEETMTEVCADRGLKVLLENSNVIRFWSSGKEHPDLGKLALENFYHSLH
ncbi:hypothetical protein O3P69_002580 [Scylla paramamosain]|uniref:Uncharacterized protein n=1 Tax=Scylla paramamosain TaxID=85552 RepID=A0AAW0UL71_SCYPA